MSRAREILREYLERRSDAEPGASPAVGEENMRRLLRHVAAAHQPSDGFETGLGQAMRRAAREGRSEPRRGARRPWFSPPVWRLGVPAVAAAAVAMALAWQLRPTPSGGTEERLAVTQPAPGPAVPSPGEPEPVLIGYVLLPEGELLRQASDGQEWERVEGGDPVRLGDHVRTEPGSAGSVVFLDGSDCRIGAGTSLTYGGGARPGMKRPSEVRLARGQAWFQVEKGGPTFSVRAPAATAVVQGTYFGVAVGANGATTLRVKEGAVRLENAAGQVMVRAGRQSTALAGRAPQAPVRLTETPQPKPGGAAAVRVPRTGPPAQSGGAVGAGGAMKEGASRTFETHDPRRPAKKPTPPAKPKATDGGQGVPMQSGGQGGERETEAPVSTSAGG